MRWLGNGRVTSDHPLARRDIDTLGLNHPQLVRRRLAALDALRQFAERGRLARAQAALDAVPWPEFRETQRSWIVRHR
jgi:hypothetical protein